MRQINDLDFANMILAKIVGQLKNGYPEAMTCVQDDKGTWVVINDQLHYCYRDLRAVIYEDKWYSVEPIQTGEKQWAKAVCEMGTVDFFDRLKEAFNKLSDLKQYRSRIEYAGPLRNYTMNKTWNRGLGCLEIWNIDIETKTILINLTLFNSTDKHHLNSLIDSVPKLKEYAVEGVYFGYPLYYNYGFLSKNLPSERKPFSLN